MDISRAVRRYALLWRQSEGFKAKARALRAIYYYTVLRFNLWEKSKRLALDVAGHRFEIDLGRKELASVLEVLLERCYEPDEAWLTAPTDTVLDIGANIGVFAILQGKRLTQGRVYAFEPSPTTYARLRRNVSLNRLDNVETFPLALGDRNGRVRFIDKPISLNSYVSTDAAQEGAVEVEAQTLDAFVATRGIDRIDLMKIDTEGHELPVLAGGARALALTGRLVLEFHRPEDELLLRQRLEEAGFALTHRERELMFFRRRPAADEPRSAARASS